MDNPFGMNSLSVWAWMFLFGHLVWATGFMFLISRGYWQELIETLAWAHERTPLASVSTTLNLFSFTDRNG
jgi:photosystem I P700 chlorophyll a apoprotein A2